MENIIWIYKDQEFAEVYFEVILLDLKAISLVPISGKLFIFVNWYTF